ncbi:MAG TPA: cytochrome b/b6 domain-containing protein [Terracidiphilus sp.]|nr:cytochrome b/b6 domain-containing protein [Terracidiphilus sp.]
MKVSSRILLPVFAIFLLGSSLPTRAQHKLKDEDCLTCHGDSSLTTQVNGKTVSLFVDAQKLQHSIHASMKLACVDCHKDVKSLAHEATPQPVTCAGCHADAQTAYAHSMHAMASKTGKTPAATCVDCHGGAHEVLAGGDPKSPVNHANIPATCGRCHGQKFLMESNGVSAQPFVSYQDSVHGRAIRNGSMNAAVCTDCHGSHEIIAANDARSPIYKFNVPATCGKCHTDIADTFHQSIHGQAIARGNALSPVCTDCHGIHSIKSHADPNSPVAAANVSRDTCAPCHEGVKLSSEFGVPGNRVSSYMDSYHGLATEAGSVVAANCSSCHGVHDILPSSDPRSTINHANLDKTCGQCHRGVTQKFVLTRVHFEDGAKPHDIGSIAVRWVRLLYIVMIVGVIGAMFLHNAIIWRSKAVARRRMQNPMMTRMTTHQRWQHLILLLSFIILVITGFALKFPDSWFAELLGMSERLRSVIHRIAGVVLMGAGIYHLVYLYAAHEGRRLIRDLAPKPKDAWDAGKTMLYYLGLSKQKPAYGRFNYAEKAEYWALVWGTALMGVTGIMLWAKVLVGDLLARWWVDVATAVHFYEAILATLAILVWHFYQVFFDPDVYPMNWAWWDGKMPVEHYEHEHALDVESLPSAKTQTTRPQTAPLGGAEPSGTTADD